jgi:hypothetical protein
MHLAMSSDLLKIWAKKPKLTHEPPKPKYMIESCNIKQIIKGHGTEAFKKTKGLFRSIPKAEKCFSIIGPATIDGVKSLNVECESEQDCDKWISYLETVVTFLRKTKVIKTNVKITK